MAGRGRRGEPAAVRHDEQLGVTLVIGGSPVIELGYALCAHARLPQLDATQLPWHHALAVALGGDGGALFDRFYGSRAFDGGFLLMDLYAAGPHRDLDRFPSWVGSLTDAQFLWLAAGRSVPLAAIEESLAGRHGVRDLRLPPEYREGVATLFDDPASSRRDFARLLGLALEAGWVDEVETLRPFWQEALDRQEADLRRLGLRSFLRRFGEAPNVVEELKAARANPRVELIPSCYVGARFVNVIGPGHLACTFQVRPPGWAADATFITLEMVRRRAEALGEVSRLSLLRLVALGKATNGRALAACSGLTPATVSRHMTQLLRAGLVNCQVQGREVRYELNGPAVRAFGQHLLDVLGQLPPEGGTSPADQAMPG
jgi:DNA-binding transcriptional ArsR family regulator